MPETIIRKRSISPSEEEEFMGNEIDGLPDLEGEEVLADSDGDDDLAAEEEIRRIEEEEAQEGDVRLMNIEPPPPTPAPQRKPPAPRKPRRRKSPMSEVNDRIDDEFMEIMSGLEFGAGESKINIIRVEPTYDPETGRKIAGHLDSFRHKIDIEDIKKRYGGGVYQVMIHGKDPRSGRSGIRARKNVEIAGAPIPPVDPREEERKRKAEENKEGDVLETILEGQARRDEIARQEQTALRRELATMQTKMFETMAKAAENKTDPTAALAPLLQQMQVATERQETIRREELARQELARKEEREEQRRRDEDRQRQWEAEQKRQEQQFKLQLEQIKADQVRAESAASARAESERANMAMMMQFMTKTDAEKESRQRESSQMQMTMFQQMNEQNSKFAEAQIKALERQVSNKDDIFGSLEKLSVVRDFFNPQESDDRATWEKVLDRAGEMLPAVVPGIAAITQGQAQAPGAAPLPPGGGPRQVGPGEGQMAPGTVMVVDDIDAAQAQYGGPEQPHAPQPEVLEPEHPQEEQVQTATENPPPAPMDNDLTDFPEEYTGDMTESLTLLVKALDYGIANEVPMDEMYAKTVGKLPMTQKLLLKSVGADMIVNYVEKSDIPAHWAIRSMDAESKIRELHAKLVSGD